MHRVKASDVMPGMEICPPLQKRYIIVNEVEEIEARKRALRLTSSAQSAISEGDHWAALMTLEEVKILLSVMHVHKGADVLIRYRHRRGESYAQLSDEVKVRVNA